MFRCPLYRKAVTAYSTNMAVIVNGYDVNSGLYPAINYRPFADRPYYTYVPIAIFNNVGAKVSYNEQTNSINVTSDYFDLQKQKDKIKDQNAYYKETNTPVNLDDIEENFKFADSTIVYTGQINFLEMNGISITSLKGDMTIENPSMYFLNGDKVSYFMTNHRIIPNPNYNPNLKMNENYSCSMDPAGCSFLLQYIQVGDIHIKTKNNSWIVTSISYY